VLSKVSSDTSSIRGYRGKIKAIGGTMGRGAAAHGRRPWWGWVREGVASPVYGDPGVLTPDIFLNSALLYMSFSVFYSKENLGFMCILC